jgi:hypothetical protein
MRRIAGEHLDRNARRGLNNAIIDLPRHRRRGVQVNAPTMKNKDSQCRRRDYR